MLIAGCYPFVNGQIESFIPPKTLVYLAQMSNVTLRGVSPVAIILICQCVAMPAHPDMNFRVNVHSVQATSSPPPKAAMRPMGEFCCPEWGLGLSTSVIYQWDVLGDIC